MKSQLSRTRSRAIARTRRVRTLSLLAGMSVLGWIGTARADWQECTVCGPDVGGYTSYCCVTVSGSDGSIGLPAHSMNYSESFESGFSWVNWENCATDGNYYAIQYYDANDNPPSGGGSYAMRLHTGGLNQSSCSFPGMYAVSPTFYATGGYSYSFSGYTRNASNNALMTALFFDANGNLLMVVDDHVSADSWQYHYSHMRIRAPANTAYAQIRFGLQTPNEYTDVDLVSVAYSP